MVGSLPCRGQAIVSCGLPASARGGRRRKTIVRPTVPPSPGVLSLDVIRLMSTPAHLEISGSPSACGIPLCVDLDGTLIRTDILWESVLILLRLNPLYVFLLPVWLAGGRANLKRQVSSRVRIDAASLPYHEELLAFLREQHRAGRPLLLATAAYRAAAEPIALHLGIFSGVVATSDSRNLKGDEKRSLLVHEYGARGFDYAGNSAADIAVWKDCNRAI